MNRLTRGSHSAGVLQNSPVGVAPRIPSSRAAARASVGDASAPRPSVKCWQPVSSRQRRMSSTVQISPLGWDDPAAIHVNAERAAEGGAAWLTIHGRTKSQGYRAPAYWRPIGEIRARLGIPIVYPSLLDFSSVSFSGDSAHSRPTPREWFPLADAKPSRWIGCDAGTVNRPSREHWAYATGQLATRSMSRAPSTFCTSI